MNVGYVSIETPSKEQGGAGVATWLLATEMARRGHSVWLVDPEGEEGGERRREGVNIMSFASRRGPLPGMGLVRTRFNVWAALRLLRKRNVNCIVVHDWLGLLPWIEKDFVVISWLQGSSTLFRHLEGKSPHRVLKALERKQLALSSAWLSPSLFALTKTSAVFAMKARKAYVIPNPVELRARAGPGDVDRNQILFVGGSLAEKKGVLTLAEAMKTILQEHPDLRLTFLGRDAIIRGRSARSRILDAVGERGDQVEFIRPVAHSEVHHWIRRARICVMPSLAETFGNVWMETLACGRPLIASNRLPATEMLEDGKTAMLVDPRCSEELGKSIRMLLEHPEFAERMGARGYERCKDELTLSRVASRHEELYQRLWRSERAVC